MEYGNTDDETTISLANANPADQVEVHVTISDPALNIDPTGVDAWMFKLDGTGATPATVFANNGSSNTALSADELADAGFIDNGRLTTDNTAVITGKDDVVMTEALLTVQCLSHLTSTEYLKSLQLTKPVATRKPYSHMEATALI